MKKVRMIADDGEGEDLGHVVMGGGGFEIKCKN